MTPSPSPHAKDLPQPRMGGFWGHPRGLATLFSTELWERFSFAGMRALLFLYMTSAVAEGGLGLPVVTAGSIAGTYGAVLYLGAVLGGWLSDRVFGPRRAVLYGGSVIALGHLCLSRPGSAFFFGGLLLLLLGTSLFKPSMNSLVGLLYPPGDRRRDAGFAIFYMGINIGGVLAPLCCGFLAQSETWKQILRSHGLRPENSWHWGFGAAAVGMSLGLVQFVIGGRQLGRIGLAPPRPAEPAARARLRRSLLGAAAALVTVPLAILIAWQRGLLHLDVAQVSSALGRLVLLVPLVYIPVLFLTGSPTRRERQRMGVIVILFLFMILFWAAEGQTGSSLALFAKRHVRNSLFGYDFPSVWWISLSSLFVIVLAPGLAWLWQKLPRQPESSTKFVLGLTFAGAGYLVLTGGAFVAVRTGQHLSPMWFAGMFFLHALGEVCLGPVGLSMVTQLTPANKNSQMLGVWFLAVSLGSVLGGAFAGGFERLPLPGLFGAVVAVLWLAALLLLLLRGTIRRLMG